MLARTESPSPSAKIATLRTMGARNGAYAWASGRSTNTSQPYVAMGACAVGRTNCVGAGVECVQQVFPETERCDNADNDCNGVVDG